MSQEYRRRPRGSQVASKVWDNASVVLGQPPSRMVVVKAHKGKSTEWLIEQGNEVKIKLVGNQQEVCKQLKEMA